MGNLYGVCRQYHSGIRFNDAQVVTRTVELEQALGELRDITTRLTSSQETERARIARELHSPRHCYKKQAASSDS